jgi:hypothetical protein
MEEQRSENIFSQGGFHGVSLSEPLGLFIRADSWVPPPKISNQNLQSEAQKSKFTYLSN